MNDRKFLAVEDLKVYRRLCWLHLEVCKLSHSWPPEERYELGSQVRRSSNSSPAQLAEKNDDRHVRNKIEGVNRARGEAAETVHHLYIAKLKSYFDDEEYQRFRSQYTECVCMLNGLEKALERKLPSSERRWEVAETVAAYQATDESPCPVGWPETELNTDT